MEKRITPQADAYLDYHRHSAEAYDHVAQVIAKTEHMVNLAMQRATDELAIPSTNVISLAEYKKDHGK